MALQKQLAHLNLRGGIDSKHDARLVIPSKLEVLQDAQFDDADTIVTRGGYSTQSTTALGSSEAISSPKRMFQHQGDLCIESLTGVHRIIPSLGASQVVCQQTSTAGIPNSHFKRAGMTLKQVSGAIPPWSGSIPSKVNNFDCNISSGISLWAWEERDVTGSGRMAIRWASFDDTTGQMIAQGILNDTSGSDIFVKPRIIATSSALFLYYGRFQSGATQFTIRMRSLTVASPASLSAEQTIFTSASTGGTIESAANAEVLFDVDYKTARTTVLGMVIRDNDAAGNLRYRDLNTSNGYSVLFSGSLAPSAVPRSLTCIITDNGTNAYITGLFGVNTNSVRAAHMTAGSTTMSAESGCASGTAATKIGRVVAIDDQPGSGSTFRIVYDNSVDGTYSSPVNGRSIIRVAEVNKSTLANVSFAQAFQGAVIYSKISASVYGTNWMAVALPSVRNQPTVYLVDIWHHIQNALDFSAAYQGPLVGARIAYGECGNISNDWHQTARIANAPVSNTYYIDVAFMRLQSDVEVVAGSLSAQQALTRATVFFADRLNQVEVNGTTILAGACPHVFDGQQVVEQGWNAAPEIGDATTFNNTTTTLAAAASGTANFSFSGSPTSAGYWVCATMGWQDAQGNWVESPPSQPVQVSISGANSYLNLNVITPLTQKANTRVILYRTLTGGSSTSTFYRAVAPGSENWGGYGGVMLSDAAIQAGTEILYTAAQLPNDPMPSCRHVATHEGRIIACGVDEGDSLAFSQPIDKQISPNWSTDFKRRIPSDFGRAVSVASMDGKLIVLGEQRIGAIFGSGPDPLNDSDSFSEIQTLVSNTGALWDGHKATALTPEGVWFQSNTYGLRLLARSGGLGKNQSGSDAGSEVDALTTGGGSVLINTAVIGTTKQQIRFYSDSDFALVWDWQWGQWSYFTNHSATDAVFAGGRFYQYGATLDYYNENIFTDTDTTQVTGIMRTSWLSFAGIQGFQRVYRMTILGALLNSVSGTPKFTVSAAYNYGSAQTAINPAGTGVSVTDFKFQADLPMPTQKCGSIQIQIAFWATNSRVRLTDLTFQVGVKHGYYKPLAATRIT